MIAKKQGLPVIMTTIGRRFGTALARQDGRRKWILGEEDFQKPSQVGRTSETEVSRTP